MSHRGQTIVFWVASLMASPRLSGVIVNHRPDSHVIRITGEIKSGSRVSIKRWSLVGSTKKKNRRDRQLFSASDSCKKS